MMREVVWFVFVRYAAFMEDLVAFCTSQFSNEVSRYYSYFFAIAITMKSNIN